jgi:pyruvate kinase
MPKLTKIVATIGPATESEAVIEQLIHAGMNVARFNTKHGTPEWHRERIARVRKVAAKLKEPVAVLLDLQGPEIRVDLPGKKSFTLAEGETVVMTAAAPTGAQKTMLVPERVVEVLQKGMLVLLDDGACEFEITAKQNRRVTAKALNACEVKHRKSLSTPGITIDMPSLIDNDLVQLDGAVESQVDYVGLSYVRSKKDIAVLRAELEKRGLRSSVVAKIENQAALDHIDEIVEASDVVMVARGDLAVEVPFEQLAFWQKLIISKCRQAAKPVITATQMLKSMVDSPRPSRAEVTDVANAVYDSTSAVMLSEETTIGRYPVKAVETQAKIVEFNEPYVSSSLENWLDDNSPSGITHAAMYLIGHQKKSVDCIVCLTETGRTAALLSRFRPKIRIHALTSNEQTYRKLALYFGVVPHIMDFPPGGVQEPDVIAAQLADHKIIRPGRNVLIIYGSIWKSPGLTNSLSIIKVPTLQ